MPLCLFAQTAIFDEYEVKAGFLEKFTRFIDWPAEVKMEDVSKPFVITVMGENPFESVLEKMYSQVSIKGKKVEIQYISTVNEIDDCNILFIPKSEHYRINKILSYTKKKPILTITDYKRFAKNGVLITLFFENDHISFEINKKAVQDSGLYVSSLLLNLSKVVNTEEN